MLRSMFFMNNDFIKSLIFTENYTHRLFYMINKIKDINIPFEFVQISNYRLDDLI